MLKIRYDLTTKWLSGWTDNEKDLLEAREGEAIVILDTPKPDADDYEYFAYDGKELVPSGKQPPIPRPTPFERLNPIEGVEHRLTHIEEWLEAQK